MADHDPVRLAKCIEQYAELRDTVEDDGCGDAYDRDARHLRPLGDFFAEREL